MDADRSAADWVAAYLEWIDVTPMAEAADGADYDWSLEAADDGEFPQLSREDVLLSALRAESDCLHVLRQVLEAVDPAPGTVQLAMYGLVEAQRLLEAEQRAWDALIDARESAWETRDAAWPADFDRAWPVTLSVVSTEMRALADRVLALRPH